MFGRQPGWGVVGEFEPARSGPFGADEVGGGIQHERYGLGDETFACWLAPFGGDVPELSQDRVEGVVDSSAGFGAGFEFALLGRLFPPPSCDLPGLGNEEREAGDDELDRKEEPDPRPF
jgi:hypothetical protein